MTAQDLIDMLSKATHKNADVNIINEHGDELFNLNDDFLTIDEDGPEAYDPNDTDAHVHIVVRERSGL